jgi:hypothetical protein
MDMSEVRLVSHSVCYLCLNSDWLAEALWRWELEARSWKLELQAASCKLQVSTGYKPNQDTRLE